jgi:Ribonuclease G/E
VPRRGNSNKKEKRRRWQNTKIEDVQERKKLKRAARKKAAPKGPRTGARGENKQKLKKAARGSRSGSRAG